MDQKDKKIKQLEDILAQAPGNIYWKDRSGRYLGCNNNFSRNIGHSIEDIIGKTDFDLLPEKYAIPVQLVDQQIIYSKKSQILEEHAYDNTGQPITYLSEKTPLFDGTGFVYGVLGTSLDISDLKQVEYILQKGKQRAEESEQQTLEFVRNMEHDLRTPFCGIIGLADILKIQEEDSEKRIILNDIVNCTTELLSYCDHIIEYSRVRGKTIAVKHDDILSIKDIVQRVIAMEKPAAKAKQLDLMTSYADNLPQQLLGDAFRLQCILINLISNAIKFTTMGYVKISVQKIDDLPHQKAMIEIQVADTGEGIALEKQEIIFNQFTRLHPSNQGTHKGFGLGLAIVKQFVLEMAGMIDVESALDEGATFICRIPFKKI